mmetsp:Transcript_21028/g.59732  ORF Transcript_21028/g.59732 Transcript_21028/m.59732 type:complete len:426 (-) Transcript_21028:361-1638(-)
MARHVLHRRQAVVVPLVLPVGPVGVAVARLHEPGRVWELFGVVVPSVVPPPVVADVHCSAVRREKQWAASGRAGATRERRHIRRGHPHLLDGSIEVGEGHLVAAGVRPRRGAQGAPEPHALGLEANVHGRAHLASWGGEIQPQRQVQIEGGLRLRPAARRHGAALLQLQAHEERLPSTDRHPPGRRDRQQSHAVGTRRQLRGVGHQRLARRVQHREAHVPRSQVAIHEVGHLGVVQDHQPAHAQAEVRDPGDELPGARGVQEDVGPEGEELVADRDHVLAGVQGEGMDALVQAVRVAVHEELPPVHGEWVRALDEDHRPGGECELAHRPSLVSTDQGGVPGCGADRDPRRGAVREAQRPRGPPLGPRLDREPLQLALQRLRDLGHFAGAPAGVQVPRPPHGLPQLRGDPVDHPPQAAERLQRVRV